MTPLVDVVFLLLIFFMLSTTFIVIPGIRLDLPRASSEQVEREPEEIVLSVDEQGKLYFGETQVDDAGMRSRLQATALGGKDTQVLLKGDAQCAYGRIVDVLEMVRKSSLHRIAIVTQSGKRQRAGDHEGQTRSSLPVRETNGSPDERE